MATTSNFGWTKPTVNGSDSTWGQTLNDRIDDVDALAGGVTTASVSGSYNVDYSSGTSVWSLTVTGNVTFSFTNPNDSGSLTAFRLYVTMSGNNTITWPASVKWANGTEPADPASGEVDSYTFESLDGGSTWYGYHTGNAFA